MDGRITDQIRGRTFVIYQDYVLLLHGAGTVFNCNYDMVSRFETRHFTNYMGHASSDVARPL
jgi:hypothetical protein